ncbi:GNAT family N-acetyltransferase [Motilibacter rhizosphaerae]|nr:GNAT family N-acetyltransferase [Motilibacter rhizosphaerae]
MPPLDDRVRARGRARIAHVLAHDPSGSWVAEDQGTLTGVSLATRRERRWFLSLLTVAPAHQGVGVGRALLDAALGTFEGTGAICASSDPKALRRYGCAGFALVPCFETHGPVDRSLLPATPHVREGSFLDDRDLVESVARHVRGAPHGVDLDYLSTTGHRLLVHDSGPQRGYVVVRDSGPALLGATTPAVAQELLWAALAEVSGPAATVSWVTGEQQWALSVALEARLALRAGGGWCAAGLRGGLPYLPSGALG